MTERQKLMQQIAAQDFAIVELNLYLDTHANDAAAKRRLSDSEHNSGQLRAEYETKYGPIVFRDTPHTRMKWIKNTWPWDLCEEED